MADYYTQFSFRVSVPGRQIAWLERLHETCLDLAENGDDAELWRRPTLDAEESRLISAATYVLARCDGYGYGNRIYFQSETDGSWIIYADEQGDPLCMGRMLQEMLCRFESDACITFTYAKTCSKPRVGAFGGGAVLVTKNIAQVSDTAETVEDLANAFEV